MSDVPVLPALTLGLAVSLAACAPRDAGFQDVRRSVTDRIRADVHWSPDDDDQGATSAETHRLLAQPLTADAAVQVALLNNRTLRADLEDLGAARAELAAAGLLPNPRVVGSLRFPTATVNPDNGADIEFEATIDLMGILLLPVRHGAARAEFEAARLRATGQAIGLAHDTRVAFYRYQAAQQTVALERSVLATAAVAFETSRELRAAGNIPDLDLAQQQVLYDETRLDLSTAENDAIQARERLNARLGVWGSETAWRAVGSLADAPAQEMDLGRVEERAIAQSLDLAALQWRITASSQRLDLARVLGVLPRVEAGVSARRELGDLTVGPTVGLVIPLFDQGQGQVGIRHAELQRTRAMYIAQAVRIRAAVRGARAELDHARQRVMFYREEFLPLRRRVLEQTQLQYNAMQTPVFQLLLARRAQIAAERASIAAQESYWNARATLAELLAGRLPEGTTGTMDSTMPGSSPTEARDQGGGV